MITDTADIHDNLRRKRFGERADEVVNHAGSGNRQNRVSARKNPLPWAALAFVLMSPLRAVGAEAWFLIPEPKFMGHHVTQPIPGAKSTVLAAVEETEFGLGFARKEQAEAATGDGVLQVTRARATEWLKQLQPAYTRDKKNVVEFATLHSETLPVAATVLAPEFWRRFEEVFGPKMRVVIPNRHTVFVFPDVETDLDQYSRMVLTAWRSGAPKVSLEVFELSERGLRAVGAFEEP